jgi:acetamidase/formamidase
MTARYPQYAIPQGQLAVTERSSYHGRSRQEAYAIASVAADLRIHEVVDVPNWVVGAFLPEAIFTS